MFLKNFHYFLLLLIRGSLAYFLNCKNLLTDSCVCIFDNSLNSTCFEVTNGLQLKQHFTRIAFDTVHSITLSNCDRMTTLPPRVFGRVKAKHLIIQKTSLSSIVTNALKGFDFENSLETLSLYDNNFEHFNFKSLARLKNLRGLRISSDQLIEVPEDALSDLPLLDYVDFSHNRIKSIKKNAFSDLPNVNLIDLRGNRLTEIDEDAFNLNNMESRVILLLNSNKLSNIHNQTFANLQIRSLELENNQLETLSQAVFEPLLDNFHSFVSDPGVLYVKGNPFKCDSSIRWLVLKILKSNSYKSHVSDFVCENNGKRLSQLNETDL